MKIKKVLIIFIFMISEDTANIHTGKFKSGVPFLNNNYLYFPTTRGFLRILSLIKDGNEFCPLDLAR
jgi:hypothetical protein